MMLIAGAIDFVVFVQKHNDYQQGGRLRRYVASIREINGVDGRVLSSEVFAPGTDGVARRGRADLLPRRAGRRGLRPRLRRRAGGLTGDLALDAAHHPARCASSAPASSCSSSRCGHASATAEGASRPGPNLLAADRTADPDRDRRRRARASWSRSWPVAALAAAALVLAGPALLGGAKAEREAMARLEGLATWTESLRDTIAGAVGLEQAIPATAYAAAPVDPAAAPAARRPAAGPHAPARRAAAAWPTTSTTRAPTSSSRRSSSTPSCAGPGLRQVLSSLADSARAELEMRQRVTAARARRGGRRRS